MTTGFRPRRRSEMDEAQVWSVDLVKKTPALLLVLPVGGGKTSITLTALLDLIRKGKAKRILVVGPLRVAEEVWSDEIAAWAHLWPLRISVVTGSEKGRLFALQTPADIYTINRENLRWLWMTMRRLGLPMFDTLVIDESTMLQDGKKRTAPRKVDGVSQGGNKLSRFGAVINFRRHAERVIELTGTVAPEGLKGLWGQVYALDYGERLGATREDFERRWFTRNEYSRKITPVRGAFEDITGRIKDVVIAPDIADRIKKIPVKFNPIWVRLSDSEMARYNKFEKDLYEHETDIEAITQGVLTNKLCQFANGSIYDEDGNDIHVHDHKLHALEDLVDELNGERLLVAYSYKFDLDRIRKRFRKAVVLNEEPGAYQAWRRGEIDMLLAHPKSAGHGLNMQTGGHHACWYGFNWSVELWQQFNGRLPRRGQAHDFVTIHLLQMRGTVDETMMEKMRAGTATQDEITAAVMRRVDSNWNLDRGVLRPRRRITLA